MSDHTLEDIEALLNGAEEEETEETPEEVEETTEEEVDEEESAPAEEEDEADPEAEATEDEEEVEPEDDWQEKAKKIQAAKDREVAQLQKELQQIREEQAEARGREAARKEYGDQEQSAQLGSVSAEDLQQGIQTNLPGTFQWTVVNRPDLVPALITMVRETEGLGNATADQMVVEYQGYLHQQSTEEREALREELRREKEAERAPLEQQEAMSSMVDGLTERFGETFAAAQDEISNRLQTDGRAYIEYLTEEAAKNGEDFQVTPELMKEMMVDIYLEIRENALNEKSMAPGEPQEVPAGAKGIGQSATDGDRSDEEDFLEGFISGAREADMTIDPSFLP